MVEWFLMMNEIYQLGIEFVTSREAMRAQKHVGQYINIDGV